MRKASWFLLIFLTATIINYPNPFNPKGGEVTTFECNTATSTEAYLYIYDMAARLILRKAYNLQGGANTRTTWNGYSDFNELVGNGVYLYQVVDTSYSRVGKGKIWVTNQ